MKKNSLKILFILDPLERLNVITDTSLALVREFEARGHQLWSADTVDLLLEKKNLFCNTQQLKSSLNLNFARSKVIRKSMEFFDLVVIRKEPPFDATYLEMTYFFDQVKSHTVISNRSEGIRKFNEKLSAFYFPDWIPETLVSASQADLLQFAKKHNHRIVVKPLDCAGGNGVFKLSPSKAIAKEEIAKATHNGKKNILFQKFVAAAGKQLFDKRLIVLDGKLIGAYERHCKKGEFRANLHKGGTFHPTVVSAGEKRMVKEMGPLLRKNGIHFAGLDVIDDQLIEINVTCPGGVIEADILYPKLKLIRQWAIFLEHLQHQRHRQLA